jgi:dihydroflavonol-4-reductase
LTRALVLGATGHLGRAITRELLGRGCSVTAATRQTAPKALMGLDVRVVTGDVERPGQLDAWMVGHGLVVDAAAPYPLALFSGGRDEVALAEARTRALVAAVRAHGARLAFVSSFTTVLGPLSGLYSMESRLRRGIHPYFSAKERMESVVREAAASGLRAVIINPTACLGPWDPKPRAQAFLAQLLDGALPATVRHVANVVDVRDVAWTLAEALDHGPEGRPILLSGHDVAVDRLVVEAARLAGVRAPVFQTSLRASTLMSFWAEAAWTAAGRTPPVGALGMFLLSESRAVAPSAEQRSLGLVPRPLEDTLRDAIAWYRTGEY